MQITKVSLLPFSTFMLPGEDALMFPVAIAAYLHTCMYNLFSMVAQLYHAEIRWLTGMPCLHYCMHEQLLQTSHLKAKKQILHSQMLPIQLKDLSYTHFPPSASKQL